jgi:acetyl-CoA C-acetyltransferase
MTLDPRTPVIVGVGQASERLDYPGYRRRSPVDLAADAARAALADAAGDGRDTAALASAIDTVAGVRQFEDSMPKPVIAAVNGYAMGGGCEIALACQLAVADATAQFALSEVKVGLIAGAGGLVRLPRTVPAKVATEMILTGRRVGADQALAYGLVNRVAPAGRALEEARALAAEILDGSPTSVRLSLQALAETRAIPDVIDAVTSTADVVDELMGSADSAEGMAAFAQKRRPVWRNY